MQKNQIVVTGIQENEMEKRKRFEQERSGEERER